MELSFFIAYFEQLTNENVMLLHDVQSLSEEQVYFRWKSTFLNFYLNLGTLIISLAVSNSSNKDSQMLSLQGDHSELFEIDRNVVFFQF